MADGSGTRLGDLAGPGTTGLDPRLLIWLSPAFPVGAFAFSHGLEQAAARGWVKDAPSLQNWIADLIRHGGLHNDLVLMAAAWRGAVLPEQDRPTSALTQINDLALALQPSAERRLETVTQGNSFMATMLTAWPCTGLAELTSALVPEHARRQQGQARSQDIAYPVAVAVACAAHGIRLDSALLGYAFAFAGNLVSAAIRLSVIGQTDGQRVLSALMPVMKEASAAAFNSTIDDLGGFSYRSDIAQLNHETQYTRLFRS